MKKMKKALLVILIVEYSLAILAQIFGLFSELVEAFTPIFLLSVSVLVLLEYKDTWTKEFTLWLIFTNVGLLIIEILGVNFGIVFGDYDYSPILGPQLLGTPLIIGFNWVIVVLSASQIVDLVKKDWNPYLKALFAGLLCLGFDIILEPTAIKLDYWQWDGGEIPFSNYLSWFILALGISFFYFRLDIKEKYHMGILNFVFQILLFSLILIFT
jgi:putative membrane protein